MKNFEIKLKIDDIDNTLSLIQKTGARREDDMHQIDYYLNIGTSKKKIREIEGVGVQIITYDRFEKLGRKESKYNIKNINQKDKEKILNEENILCVVDKIRMLWIYKNTRIHLDRVIDLGYFLELETVIKDISAAKGLNEFKEMLEILKIDPQKAIVGSYSDLIINSQKSHTSPYFMNNFASC